MRKVIRIVFILVLTISCAYAAKQTTGLVWDREALPLVKFSGLPANTGKISEIKAFGSNRIEYGAAEFKASGFSLSLADPEPDQLHPLAPHFPYSNIKIDAPEAQWMNETNFFAYRRGKQVGIFFPMYHDRSGNASRVCFVWVDRPVRISGVGTQEGQDATTHYDVDLNLTRGWNMYCYTYRKTQTPERTVWSVSYSDELPQSARWVYDEREFDPLSGGGRVKNKRGGT